MANQYKTISDMFAAFTEKFAPLVKKRVFDLDAKDIEKFADLLDKYLSTNDTDDTESTETQQPSPTPTASEQPAPKPDVEVKPTKNKWVLDEALSKSCPPVQSGAIVYNRKIKKIGIVVSRVYSIANTLSDNITPESIRWKLRVKYISANSILVEGTCYTDTDDVEVLIADPKRIDKAKLAQELVIDTPYISWINRQHFKNGYGLTTVQYITSVSYNENAVFNLSDFYINDSSLTELAQADATVQNEPIIHYIASKIKAEHLYIDNKS